MRQLENSLRIKVTGECNRNCFFCHKEGGMNHIEKIEYSEKLRDIVNTFCDALGLKSIALTGGEPLLNDDLYDFVYNLSANTHVHQFSLTTNGTILKDYMFWHNLHDAGLYKVNISMPDILDANVLLNPNESIETIFHSQIQLISMFNKLGIETKINIVIFNDFIYTRNILSRLIALSKDNSFELVLLPNLLNAETFEYSQSIIKHIREDMRLQKISQKNRPGTSRVEETFMTEHGESISIKTTKTDGEPYYLPYLCDKCTLKKKTCQEGFYGIRLEQMNNKYYIRLCIYRNDKSALMSIDDFLNSNIYKYLSANWMDTKVE